MKKIIASLWIYTKKFLWWGTSSVLFVLLFAVVFALIQLGRVMSYNNVVFEGDAHCGVIFGAAVWRDNIPSHALSDRISAAASLYDQGRIDCLVLSGGPSKLGAHEIDVMHQELLKLNVPDSDILFDYYGVTTRETIQNLPYDGAPFVFISHDFHLARIALLASRHGVDDFYVHAVDPRNGPLSNLYYYRAREVLANFIYSFYFPN